LAAAFSSFHTLFGMLIFDWSSTGLHSQITQSEIHSEIGYHVIGYRKSCTAP